jgi:hypothetical protein
MTAALSNSRYYDIDDFLADEELLPCTTTYDFALLGHLKASEGSNHHNSNNATPHQQQPQKDRHLAANTKLQMPIWTLREWVRLNYVRIVHVPKKYSSTARDAVKADPLQCELSESYFGSGKAIVQMLSSSGGPDNSEAAELQQTLLQVRFVKLACWLWYHDLFLGMP